MTAAATRPSDLASFEKVLAAARLGEAGAFETLYRALAARVCAVLRMSGAEDPEDLTSEVFLRVFNHIEKFEGNEAQFRAWVVTIANRLAIDESRKRSVRPQSEHFANGLADQIVGGDAEHEALAVIDRKKVSDALNALPSAQRDVLVLRVLGDMTVEQTAQALRKPTGAVKALQRRAHERLRRHFEQEANR